MEKKIDNLSKNEEAVVTEVDTHKHGQKKSKMGMKHGLMMILCCMLPIVIIGLLPILGIKGLSYSWMIFLLCPLMHLGMMFFMKDHH